MNILLHKLQILLLFLVLGLSFMACTKESSPVSNQLIQYTNSGKKALVVIVENSDIIGFSDQNMYNMYKSSIVPVLASIFGVPGSALYKLSLLQIIKQYGEPWQIKQICDSAKYHYDKIVVLNHTSATLQCLKDSLLDLNGKYCIDLILNIHGSQYSVQFSDREVLIGELTGTIKDNGIKIRTVYQTCCYGKFMIGSWNNIGVYAVNGAEGNNVITLFSSSYFVKEWTSGKKFDDAVYSAFNDEIAKLKTFNSQLPIDTYLLTAENLNNSLQSVGGFDYSILWKQIPVRY